MRVHRPAFAVLVAILALIPAVLAAADPDPGVAAKAPVKPGAQLNAGATEDRGAGAVAAEALSGVWSLDRNRSDDLVETLESYLARSAPAGGRDQGRGGSGGGMGGGMGGGRGGRGGMGGSMNDPSDVGSHPGREGRQAGDPEAGPQAMAAAFDQVLISRDGEAIEIMDGSDRTVRWIPDGRTSTRETRRGAVVEQAWWDGGVLVLATRGGPVDITRRLRPGDDGRSLEVDVVFGRAGTSDTARAHLVYTGY
jgi:hypothetical protein